MMKFHKLLKPQPAPFFILGLLISYNFMENWLNSTMMDYLTVSLNSEKDSAIIRNMQDGLSCLFVVIAYQISEVYGSFTAIAFCATASTMGSMLFWISTLSDRENFEYYMVYVAIVLITMGNIAGRCLSEDFFDFQLEKARAKKEELGQQCTNNNARQDHTFSLWEVFVFVVSFVAVICFSEVIDDNNPWHGTRFVSLFMVGSYMLFYFGYAWYKHEDLLVKKSNVGKFCRVCKAAYRKRTLEYLTSKNDYYWKNYKQGHLYVANHGQDQVVRLLPRVPCGFGWLEKAAIIDKKQTENHDVSPHMQETKRELCTVKQVREAKSIVLLLCWGLCLFPYSFVAASGNSFFVSQASSLKSFMHIDISCLFLLKTTMTDMVIPMFFRLVEKVIVAEKINKIIIKFGAMRKRIVSTTVKIGIGMFLAAISCVFAWRVERHILYSPGIMTTEALIPQFLLLGMAEALVEDGLSKLFENYASESVRNFAEPFSNLTNGLGKLLSIPWFLIFDGWLYESNNTASRHLDRYFLMLAILNIVSLIGFSFYYYKFVHDNECPKDEEETMVEQILVDDGANGVEQNSATNQGPEVPEEDKEIEMEQISEHDHEIEPISEHATERRTFDNNL